MEYASFSHKGLQRKSNEDYCHVHEGKQNTAFMIVADGMGGHNAGDLASKLAVEHVVAYFTNKSGELQSSEEFIQALLSSIEEANEKIFNLSQCNMQFYGMGTTFTMAVFHNKQFHVAHIGDSRCYLIRKDTVSQITRDHSLVQELLDNGSITEDEMELHPKKNIITRALGTEDKIKVDCFEGVLKDGDIVLLCTDGLTNYVNIEESIKELPADTAMDKLTWFLGNKALASGGADDITIVAARYTGKENRGEVIAG
ncbi:MAG TPA: Stp1/IreP family PP2C-type Ser/Thr phosphatase [Clostridiales bacterium]|nr:Stp1/IreP family PP2C-type Ser/Thr phosphatase [Clostridia bacterium]HCS72505.1 Stp1/IreP family PP2C-type Ser/Thr phosphatase [Clostridiales bacterium]